MNYLRNILNTTASLALVGSLSWGLAPAAAHAQEATFVIASSAVGAPSYNPVKSTMLNISNYLIYDRLVEQDEKQQFHPHLAESWEAAPDGMSWVFKLRKGVKFHDAEPFNAQTIVDWLALFQGTENQFMIDAIDKIEVVDDHTVKLLMKQPDPNLLFNFASVFMGVPSPKAVKELGDDYGITTAVGTGPYKLESFAVGQETVLTRNDDYSWGSELSHNQGPAKIQKLTMREIPEQSTAFLELKTGGIDLLYDVPTDFLPQIKATPNLETLSLPGLVVMYMPINTSVEPFTDVRVREATALAVNQKEILDNIYKGVGAEAHNFLISSLAEANVDPKYNVSYDPAKAKALLDEAGWAMGPDGVRQKDGKPLSVTLWTQGDTEFKRASEAVQAQLKAIGMNAEITVYDSSTIRDLYKKNQHQLAVRSYDWANADILDWFFSGKRLGYPNISMWNDPKSEELNKKAMTESRTWEERVANFKTYHEHLLSQWLFAPIYQPVQNISYNKDRLRVPADIRGPGLRGQTILDMDVVE